MFKIFLALIIILISSTEIFAQNASINGVITAEEDGLELDGANVFLIGTKYGAKAGGNGEFKITDIAPGKYRLKISFIGYTTQYINTELNSGQVLELVIELETSDITSKAVSVVSSRAEFRETPVAFSTVSKEELEIKLGNRDIPMLMNQTPGVYASENGGGAGDARINIRGFNQRNIAVMINGVPINDMESGWVYWSNWAGLGDVTSSVQIQRGLGASRIANPSIGGTMNIVSDAAQQRPGFEFRQAYGSDMYLKSSLIANTGKMDDWAFTFMGIRSTGDGAIDMTYNDQWTYYFAASYDLSIDHQFDLYVTGAPQEHGQRYYRSKQKIWVFDTEYALDNGVTEDDIDDRVNSDLGISYNPNWGYISDPGQSYYNGSLHDTRFNDRLMDRENYYHKPYINLNWFWQISENVSLTNVFYTSFGNGGGSSGKGFPFLYLQDRPGEDGQLDFQKKYDNHQVNIDDRWSLTETRALTALGNNVNNHNWYGYLGTFDIQATRNLYIQAGLDIRFYTGEHYSEVRNLLGGDYYVETIRNNFGEFPDSTSNLNNANDKDKWMRRLGDKIGWHNENTINWYGGFAQAEYRGADITAYINLSTSFNQYKRLDHFRTPESTPSNEMDWVNLSGWTIKGGANYNISKTVNIYANTGYYTRPPLFRAVIDFDNTVTDPLINENVYSVELGTGYMDDGIRANLNTYITYWEDRNWNTSATDDSTGRVFRVLLRGIDARHMGIEFDADYNIFRNLKLNLMASYADWQWINDVNATVSNDEFPNVKDTVNVYSHGLHVGDAAQKTLGAGITWFFARRSYFNINYTYFMDYYSNFDPIKRDDPTRRDQPWIIPNYGLADLHAKYTLPFEFPYGGDIALKLNVFNLFDTKYISDADEGNLYDQGGEDDPDSEKPRGFERNAANAYVFFGMPLRWSLALWIEF